MGVFTDIGVLLPSKLGKYSDGTLKKEPSGAASGAVGSPLGGTVVAGRGNVPRQV